jgi:hypothetical protein
MPKVPPLGPWPALPAGGFPSDSDQEEDQMTAVIAGLEPGCRIRLRGMVGIGADGRPAMVNPAHDLLG